MESQVTRPLPKYRCHKEVWALKIKSIKKLTPTIDQLEEILNEGKEPPGGFVTPEDEGYAEFSVSKQYLDKHNPQPGGYWVRYADGYESYSPATAFEDGYTLIE